MDSVFISAPVPAYGYVRLSRDDSRRRYSSIENQKKIIEKYAEENHLLLRHIYEDDGFSGYSFDRPAFHSMMEHLDSVRVIIAKDLSRIGRHNAKVLLFLEEMEELGKRIILIDDNYDSFHSDDDILGIKTWDNERHVKTTSKKVKRIKRMEQENGTLKSTPPFGYIRNPLNRQQILIDEEAAAILNLEKDLYLEGNGMRRIAEILTARKVPTPTMIQKERHDSLGLPYRRQVIRTWSSGMVRDTLFNDYHNGIFRTHKRERVTINGRDRKVPEEKQFIFYGHHPKIFDDQTAKLLQSIKCSRIHGCYRGQRKHINLYSGCLYCADCGSKMTAINRPNRKKYYVCSLYNKKGTKYCSCSHIISEEILTDALIHYLSVLKSSCPDIIRGAEISHPEGQTYSPQNTRRYLERELKKAKDDLKTLLSQKIRELTVNPTMQGPICEAYDSVQRELSLSIADMESALHSAAAFVSQHSSSPPSHISPQEVWNNIIADKSLIRTDVELLVDTIRTDGDGNADIFLKCAFSPKSFD